MDGLTGLLARVVHRRKVAAWNKSNFVPIAIVIRGKQAARLFVLFAAVVQRQPTDRPGHSALRAASRKGIAPRTDAFRPIIRSFVFADRALRSDLNLVHAHHGNVSEKPAAQTKHICVAMLGAHCWPAHGDRSRRNRRPTEKPTPGPVAAHNPSFPPLSGTFWMALLFGRIIQEPAGLPTRREAERSR